ncbi:MAG: hypothetical protein IPL78_35410 [Chloroflexi bacterium]|nr:hypothetical protein [Chloroflexota bacterium]
MAVDYSVYTVLQASRRSWRIGQTEPVKVYFYAYEATLQEDALRLVAAKVAAALRVNGDTIADDSLAELDELSGGDIVTTLARIVTGEVQVSAQSLQQAFAEANAGLRQANQMIGGYEIIEEAVVEAPVELTPLPHPTGNGNGHAVRPLVHEWEWSSTPAFPVCRNDCASQRRGRERGNQQWFDIIEYANQRHSDPICTNQRSHPRQWQGQPQPTEQRLQP